MKQIISLLMACGMFVITLAQDPLEPCCNIIKKNNNNTVLARDNTTGRLYQFNAAAGAINAAKPGDPIIISQNKVIAKNNFSGSYATVKPEYAAPCCSIVKIEPDPLEPCCAIVTYKNISTGSLSKFKVPKNIAGPLQVGDPVYSEPVNTITINNAEPVGVKNMRKHGGEPCCNIVKIEPDPSEPCCAIITYKNNTSGAVSTMRVNKSLNNVKVGQPLYAEPVTDFAIVQSSYGSNNGEMSLYGYPATSAEETGNATGNGTDKWIITPVTSMKGILGRLNTNFPADVEWSIDVKTGENKFITNRSGFSKHGPAYDLAPGNYSFRLNTITVETVPIEKGKETRLKAGYLSIVSNGNWNLYDESKQKFHTSGNKPKKIALPVGNYQLKMSGQFFPVVIKDGKTVEM